MKIIVLSGKARSGKSTCADHLIAEHGYERISFAAPLKQEIHRIGFDQVHIDQKPDWMRRLMVALGMARRAINPNHWVDILSAQLVASQSEKFVCDDCRFENEVAYFGNLRANGADVTFVRIERQYDEPRAAVLDDESETALDRFDGFDFVVTVGSGEVDKLKRAMDFIVEGNLDEYRDVAFTGVQSTEPEPETEPDLAQDGGAPLDQIDMDFDGGNPPPISDSPLGQD